MKQFFKLRIGLAVLLLSLFSTAARAQQQDSISQRAAFDSAFAGLDTTFITTGFLYDKAIHFRDSSLLDSADNYKIMTPFEFMQLYREQYNMALNPSRMIDPDSLWRRIVYQIDSNGTIPLLIMNFAYDRIKPYALDSNLIDTVGGKFYDVTNRTENPYYQEQKIIMCLAAMGYADSAAKIKISRDFYFSNTGTEPDTIKIDLNDGQGLRQVSWGDTLTVAYQPDTSGSMQSSGGSFYTQYTKIQLNFASFIVQMENFLNKLEMDDGDKDERFMLQADIPFGPSQGYLMEAISPLKARGLITIKYGKTNGIKHTELKKPIIFVEGIDFGYKGYPTGCRYGKCGDLGYIDVLKGIDYDLSKFALDPEDSESIEKAPDFIEALNNAGYDFIFLDFYDGATYMQRNAYLLVKLIQWVNDNKHCDEENVVVGVSMGGQVAKFALTYMEKQLAQTNNTAFDHKTRLYVSFDSPHQGANIALGVQHFINYMSTESEDAKTASDNLLRPAAKQLLNYHFDNQAYTYRNSFIYDLWQAGSRPEQLRRVAIVNGSKTGTGQSFQAGEQLLEYHYSGGIVNINADVWALNGINWFGWPRVVFVGDVPLKNQRFNYVNSDYKTYDNAPGGQYKIPEKLAGAQYINAWYTAKQDIRVGYVRALHNRTCFIPSISALDVNTNSLFYNIGDNIDINNPDPNLTSFHSYYAPNNNELHVQITDSNINYGMSQLAWSRNALTSALPNSNGNSYNYGNRFHKQLFSVDVNNNGRLRINANDFTEYGSGPAAEASSTFTVRASGRCNNSRVAINNGGEMIIGDAAPSGNNNKAIVIFPSGTELHLGTGSKLVINNGSTLIIEAGARLIVEYGAAIELKGSNAVINIKDGGHLALGSNATFTFTRGNASNIGYIRLENSSWATNTQPFININASTGAKFELEGNNSDEKLLEVAGSEGIVTNSNLSLFSVKKCKIIMNTEGSKQPRISIFTPITIDEVKMYSSNSKKHRGLHIYGQAGINISNFTVDRGVWGIKSISYLGQKTLTLTNFTANSCDVGLYSEGQGVNLISPTFQLCKKGWQAEGMTAASKFLSGTVIGYFTSAEYGILYKSSNLSPFYLSGSSISSNISGVAVYGAPLFSWCNSIHSNYSHGYFMGTSSLLYSGNNLSTVSGTTQSTGYTKFSNNPIDLRVDRAFGLNINEGYNNFGANTDISGTLFLLAQSTIYAKVNYWNSPIINLTKQKFNSNGTMGTASVSVITNNPLTNPVSTCQVISKSGCCSTGSIVKSQPFSGGNNPTFTSGIYQGIPLDEAVGSATIDLTDEDTVVGSAIDNLSTILRYDYSNSTLNENDSILLDAAYHNLLEAAGTGVSKGEIEVDRNSTNLNSSLAKVINTQNILLSQLNLNENCITTCTHVCGPECGEECQHECTEECSTCTEFCFTTCSTARDAVYMKKLNLTVDKVTTYILAEKRLKAIEVIDSAYSWVILEDQTSLNYWRCLASKELDYINGIISIYDTTAMYSICSLGEDNDSSTIIIDPFIIDSTIIDTSASLIAKRKGNTNIFDTSLSPDQYTINNNYVNNTSNIFSIPKDKDDDYISVYPNPVQSELNIEIYSKETSPATVLVRDITSKSIITFKVDQVLQKGKNVIWLSTRELPSGVYLLQIQTKDKTYQQKIVVVH